MSSIPPRQRACQGCRTCGAEQTLQVLNVLFCKAMSCSWTIQDVLNSSLSLCSSDVALPQAGWRCLCIWSHFCLHHLKLKLRLRNVQIDYCFLKSRVCLLQLNPTLFRFSLSKSSSSLIFRLSSLSILLSYLYL